MQEVPIVTFRELNAAFNGKESVPPKTNEIANDVADNPLEAAMMMSSLSEALRVIEESEKVPGVLVAPDHKFASLLQTYAAENATDFEKIQTGGVEAKFDNNDLLGWVGSLFTWFKGLKKHAWSSTPGQPVTFNNEARLALLGDWGTGLYGAPSCAQSIAADAAGYDLLLHLGDVYYSGGAKEVADRFLKLWPKNDTTLKNAVSRACNSNHEMYTGGDSYFKLTLPAFNQAASYFAMENDYWILAGLDSAYYTPDVMHNRAEISQDQIDWLNGLAAGAGDKKIILFSHHQPFSFFEGDNPQMVGKLNHLLTGGKIFAWYWGHEHRCVIYDKHPIWNLFGRCAGHSGFPYFRDDLAPYTLLNKTALDTRWITLPTKNLNPGAIVLDGPNPFVTGEENKYGVQGYMTLQFSDRHLKELAHAPDGTILYEQELI